MTTADELERCRRIPTATWSDVFDRREMTGIITGLHPRAGDLPIAGPIMTVSEQLGPLGWATPDEFGIDLILPHAQPGQIVLIHQSGGPMASALGGLAALAALRHGVSGVIIDGSCRDVPELVECGLPVVSRDVTPLSGRGRVRVVDTNVSLVIDGIHVEPGDVAVADEAGVAIIPAPLLDDLLVRAERLSRDESARAEAMRR